MDLLGILTASRFRPDDMPAHGDRSAGEIRGMADSWGTGNCDHLRASIDLYTEVMLTRSLRPAPERFV